MSKLKNLNEEVWYDHKTGRWMCPTETDALDMVEKHPGDYVYIYDIDKNNKIVNERVFWSLRMEDKHKLPNIRNGQMRK